MRTTVNIDENLFAHAKEIAASRGLTLGGYLEKLIRSDMTKPDEPKNVAKIKLPTFSYVKLNPTIDWTSNTSIFEFLDAEEDK